MFRYVICPILLMGLFLVPGCSFIQDSGKISMPGQRYVMHHHSLQKGYTAFHLGDFQQAESIFKTLQQVENKEIAQKAQYALTCTQLVSTRNLRGQKDAIRKLRQWLHGKQTQMSKNDLTLLVAALDHLINKDVEIKTPVASDGVIATDLQGQLKSKNEEIYTLNQKVKDLQKQISHLKDKIKSFEEIDQKIQEKKSPYNHRKLF